MKNFKLSHLFAAAVLVACLSFTGCKPAEDATAQVVVANYVYQQTYYKTLISGTWKSQYNDGYTINTSSVVYDDGGGYGFGWTRTIAEISDKYIYLVENNKYYAVSYKDWDAVSCKFANAYKAGGKTSADSLLEAKTEFTIENGYFDLYGTYSKQY
ncbi:MAG: hypothetical protein SOZ96_04110 [Treponema sp.]|nr:hypothetical protein [Treponema sp.]